MFYKILRKIVFAYSRLPFGVHYALSDFACFLAYRIVRYRLKVVRNNLLIAFPEKTDAERKQIEKRFYKHFCDYIFETIKNLTIDKDELLKHMVFRNPEFVNDYAKNGRSVFIYAAHLGNWEWFTSFPYYFPDAEIHTFYQPQKNKFVDELTVFSRSRHNITAFPSRHGYRHMLECKRKGLRTVTLIIGDQSPHRGAQKYWTNFFGRDTAFLVGPATIAKKADQVLVYPSYVGYKRGYYEVELKLISDDVSNTDNGVLIDRFAALLEDDIKRIPELWLWSHRRWKHKHEDFPDEK